MTEGRPLTRREIRLREMAAGNLHVEGADDTANAVPAADVHAVDVSSTEASTETSFDSLITADSADIADFADTAEEVDREPQKAKRSFFGFGRKETKEPIENEAHEPHDAEQGHELQDHEQQDHEQLYDQQGQQPVVEAASAPVTGATSADISHLNDDVVQEMAGVHEIHDLENARAFIAEVEAINISTHDENGNLRSRKEIRELRAAAELALALKYQSFEPAPAVAEPEPVVTEPAPAVAEPETAVAEPAPAVTEPAPAFAETEATAAELDDNDDPQLVALEEADDFDLDSDLDDTDDTDDTEPDESDDTASTDAATETEAEIVFTYPDISPVDEPVSVFDAPGLRGFGKPTADLAPEADFDDLIARAVVQEGAASPTNTSALILPTMPTDNIISAPIHETGEILLTGSITLPRSLSETGSHMPLVDEHHHDHIGIVDELHPEDPTITTGHMAPISAVRAVSATSITGTLVDETKTDKSKLPIILIASGAGLVVVAGGLLIWAAAAGLFA